MAMNCTVRIASPLRSYTSEAASVQASGTSVAAVLTELDSRFPGMRFRIIDEQDRIRPHIRLFIGSREIEKLSESLASGDTLHLLCALSGG
jgi:molybdopterin converting factor small subunit